MLQIIKKAFTLVELLVVIAIIGILATGIYAYSGRAKDKTRYARVKEELKQLGTALEHYLNDYGAYPADVNRGLPNGIEAYIKRGNWPNGPWDHSVYDWDNWTINNEQIAQISLRFCGSADSEQACLDYMPAIFPTFDKYSAVYYCLEGSCRAHSSKPANHPGLCINCGQDENAILWGGN